MAADFLSLFWRRRSWFEGMKHLIVLGGATATGKTALAIQLAQQFNTEIVSADSRQFYREMSIGTAKPSPIELAAAPHHLIDNLSVTDRYSVGDFERDAMATLHTIFETNDVAILVGGSGLFLRAVYAGLDQFPDVTAETKQLVAENTEKGGLAWMQKTLQQLDPVHFAQVDKQNPARMRRALEVCLQTGQPYSSFLSSSSPQSRPFKPIYVLLTVPRPILYARINARVDAMMEAGLEQEVQGLREFQQLTPLKTVGYEEFFQFFDGKISRSTAIEKIKQHSRNYAKRQGTWFSKHGEWTAFSPDDLPGILAFLAKKNVCK